MSTANWRTALLGAVLMVAACGSPESDEAPKLTVVQPSALAGTAWEAQEIEGKPVAVPKNTTLVFLGTDKVNGSTGCNRYFGPVTIQGDTMLFGYLATQRRSCQSGTVAQERQFLSAMSRARRFGLRDNCLLLFAETDSPVVRFCRSEWG